MAKRGPSLYPKTAVKRAECIACNLGLKPESIEVTRHKDGTSTQGGRSNGRSRLLATLR